MHCLVTSGTSYPLPSLMILSSIRYSHCIVCNQFFSQGFQDFCQAQVSLQLLKYCFSLHSIEGKWNKSGYYSPSFADVFLCFLFWLSLGLFLIWTEWEGDTALLWQPVLAGNISMFSIISFPSLTVGITTAGCSRWFENNYFNEMSTADAFAQCSHFMCWESIASFSKHSN